MIDHRLKTLADAVGGGRVLEFRHLVSEIGTVAGHPRIDHHGVGVGRGLCLIRRRYRRGEIQPAAIAVTRHIAGSTSVKIQATRQRRGIQGLREILNGLLHIVRRNLVLAQPLLFLPFRLHFCLLISQIVLGIDKVLAIGRIIWIALQRLLEKSYCARPITFFVGLNTLLVGRARLLFRNIGAGRSGEASKYVPEIRPVVRTATTTTT